MADPRGPRDDLVTVTTAAHRLGLSRRATLRWIHTGRLAFTRYPNGTYRVSSADIAKIQATTRSIAV
jgi:excisionase family DNA binding protein